MRRVTLACLMLMLAAPAAFTEPYLVSWDGSDWPDVPGAPWYRIWGTWQGDYQGPGAIRTLQGGILSYDSLADLGIYDYYEVDRPGQLDPGPVEVFIAQWRVRVDQVVGSWPYDPGLAVQSNESWGVCLVLGAGAVLSVYEQVTVATYPAPPPGEPGEFHSFDLRSSDMRTYTLAMDGEVVHEGAFHHSLSVSWVAWGDSVMGTASVHQWDYFRFGVAALLRGDVNCDGTIDFADINPFVALLTGGGGSEPVPPGCLTENADINGDGSVDFGDINPFVDLLTS